VSLSRDAGTGDYALEAGALVLADQGKKREQKNNVCRSEFAPLVYVKHFLLLAMGF